MKSAQPSTAVGTTFHPARAALDLLSAEELRDLARIRPLTIAAAGLWTWALILGAIALWAKTGSLLLLAVGFLVVGACQHALFLLAHEGAHFCVARSKAWNDLVSDLLFAGPIGLTTQGYRSGHLPHHAHLGQHGRDLEWRLWVLLRGEHGGRLLARGLSGWTAMRAILGLSADKVGAQQAPTRYLATVGLTNSALLLYAWGLGAPFAYLWLWFLPLCTLTYVLLIVRAVAEHQPWSYASRLEPDPTTDLQPVLTRTFEVGPVERFFFAPVGAQHHEHHAFPGIPFAQLPRLHGLLVARGYFDETPELVEASYLGLLVRMARLRPPHPSEPRGRTVPSPAKTQP